MKLPAVAITLALIPMQLHAASIVQKALDEFVIYNLPVAFKSGNTTVLFPSAISGLYAKSVAVQEQANADFLISFTPGNFYFTIRALEPNAEDHLTVIHNRKAYVLHLIASEQPHFHVMIRDVWRFEQEDTLIFRVELVNDSDSTIFLAALCRAKTVAKVGNHDGHDITGFIDDVLLPQLR